uniref:Uncharacterized protein n=1 Tax=Anguilla anguilla TaxID=7936 RepID=A0A0E9TGM2_ANGAN
MFCDVVLKCYFIVPVLNCLTEQFCILFYIVASLRLGLLAVL